MSRVFRYLVFAVVTALALSVIPGVAQQGAKDGEWRAYAGDSRQHALRSVRADHARQREGPPGRLELEVRQLRRRQQRDDADHGERHPVLHGGPAPERHRRQPRHRRDAVDVEARRRRALRSGAAKGRARRRLLDRRHECQDHHGDAGLSAGRARRENRHSGPRLREGRLGRSLHAARSDDAPRSRRQDRQQFGAGRVERRDRHRSRADAGRHEPQQGKRQGRRHGVRRPHGKETVDVPHDPALRRARLRNMAERVGDVLGQRRRVGPVFGRRRARLRVPGHRIPDQRRIRRPSPGQQPVLRFARLSRYQDRQDDLVQAAHPPRHLGLRHAGASDPAGRQRRRTADQVGGPDGEDGVRVRARPHERPAGVADSRCPGAADRRADRMDRGHAADSQQAAAVRRRGRHHRRSDQLHAGASRGSAPGGAGIPGRRAIRAAVARRPEREPRHHRRAGIRRRRQLAVRRVGSRDRFRVRRIAYAAVRGRRRENRSA